MFVALINAVSIGAILVIFTMWIHEKTRKIESRTAFYTYATPQIIILGGSFVFGYTTYETLFMIAAFTMGSGLFYSFIEEPSLR